MHERKVAAPKCFMHFSWHISYEIEIIIELTSQPDRQPAEINQIHFPLYMHGENSLSLSQFVSLL
jgi:hypothetical protein